MRIRAWLLVLIATATPSFATTINLGGTGDLSVFPFGCGTSCSVRYLGEYQQIYSATAFVGPFTITQVAFKTVSIGGSLDDSFSLSLGTTSATPAAPGTTYAGNRRLDFTKVFSGTVTVPATGRGGFDFLIKLKTPFSYDPAQGNLLLDVDIFSATIGFPLEAVAFDSGTSPNVGSLFNDGGTPSRLWRSASGSPAFRFGTFAPWA